MEIQLLQRKDRNNAWYIVGDFLGKRVNQSTFCKETEKEEAELIFQAFLTNLKGEYIGKEKPQLTFNECSIDHIQFETKKTKDRDEDYIEALKPYIGNLPMDKISRLYMKPSPLSKFVKDRVKRENTITTVNKHLTFINTLGDKCVTKYGILPFWNKVLTISPEEGLALGLQPKKKKKHLTREMEKVLINHLPLSNGNQHLRDKNGDPSSIREMVTLAINTGFREALLCSLEWKWLKKDNDKLWYFEIPAERMKNYKYLDNDEDQVFVLNSIAREIVRKREFNGSEFVFPLPGSLGLKSVKLLNTTSYRTARKRGALQLPNLAKTDVHSFRRTFATRLREQMVPKEQEKMMLGHKAKDDVTERYIRVSAEIREQFYEYAELIVGENKAPLRLFSVNSDANYRKEKAMA
jgi:integrase